MTRKTGFYRHLWAGAALLALLTATHSTAAPTPTTVQVLGVGGEILDGRLDRLDAEAAVVATAAGRKTVPLGRIRRLDVRGSNARTLVGAPHLRVVLTGGEVLLGTYAEGIDDGLVLATPDLGRVPLLLEVVRTIVPVPGTADACFEPEQRHPPGADDVAYMQSGDHVAGIVLAITPTGVEIETASSTRNRKIPWSDLLVLHLQNDPVPPVQGVMVEIETVDGARLTAAAGATFDAEAATLALALRSIPNRPLTIPIARIRTLRTQGGAFVYASDLPFESTFDSYYGDGTPEATFLSRWFEARVDRRPTGCPLRLEGVAYRHGFAVHARSRVTLRLDRAWQGFETLFGVDDEALAVKTGGVVNARVRGDGRVLWEAEGVRAGEAPQRIGPLDVSGVEVLVLEVDFGAELHVRDRATWADPILIRK